MSTAGTSKGRKRKAGSAEALLAGKKVKAVQASPLHCSASDATVSWSNSVEIVNSLLLQEVLAPVAVLKMRMEHQTAAAHLDSEAASAQLGFKCRAVRAQHGLY